MSKKRYERRGMITSLEVRYNAIGAPIPVAEMDGEFMDGIDYE